MPRQTMMGPRKQQFYLQITPEKACLLRQVLPRHRVGESPLLDTLASSVQEGLDHLQTVLARLPADGAALAASATSNPTEGRPQ